MRTLEELERLAYIEGRVEEAKILAQAHDELEKARATLGEVKALCERAEE